MKNLITLKSYDNSYTRAINPDHIVSFFEVDGDSCIKLSNGETFTVDNHIGNIFFHRKDNGGLLVLLCSYLYLLFKLLNQCLNFIVSQHIGIFV